MGAQTQGRYEHDIKYDFEFTTTEEVYTAKEGVSTAKPVSTAGVAVTTASASIITASPPRVSTAEDISTTETLVYIRRSASKDKGKGIMTESKLKQTKTKLQQRQERLGYEAAMRMQEQLNVEERQRIAIVHEEASSFNIKEWDNVEARIEADEELARRLQEEERESLHVAVEKISFDELKSLFEATMKRVNTFTPMKSDVDRVVPKLAAESSKRDVEEELDQESSKRQKKVLSWQLKVQRGRIVRN
ncbi:hypothetical protein Tco_0987559 [Tanacetum coccineum]